MYILADIGATKMRIAGSGDLSNFDSPTIVPTPHDYQTALNTLVEAAALHAAGQSIEEMMVGVAGIRSRDKRTLARMPHLPAWEGRELAADLESALKTTVQIENDTALVGLGEAVYGAGRGASIVAYITVSTGVNGVRIVDQKIDRTVFGFEIGGQYLSIDSTPETFEDLVAGSTVEAKTGMHPRDIPKDSPLWEDLARITAFAVHNSILHWSPDRVVLGGSMFNEIGISVDRVQEHVRDVMKKFPEIPEIVHSSLGDVGGLHGGLEALKQRL